MLASWSACGLPHCYFSARMLTRVSKAPARPALGSTTNAENSVSRPPRSSYADRGKRRGRGLGASGRLLHGPASESIAETLHAMVDQELPTRPCWRLDGHDRSGPNGSEETPVVIGQGLIEPPDRNGSGGEPTSLADPTGDARSMPGPVGHSRRMRAGLASILNRIRAC